MAGATLPGMDQGAGSHPLYQLGLQHGQQLAAIQPGDFDEQPGNPRSRPGYGIGGNMAYQDRPVDFFNSNSSNAFHPWGANGPAAQPLPQFNRSGSMQTMPRSMPAAGQQQPAPASYGFPPLPGGNIPGTNTQRTQALQTAMPFPGQQYDATGTRIGNPMGMHYGTDLERQARARLPGAASDPIKAEADLQSKWEQQQAAQGPHSGSTVFGLGYVGDVNPGRQPLPGEAAAQRRLDLQSPIFGAAGFGGRPTTDNAGNLIDQRQFDAQGNRLPAAAPTMQDTNRALQNVINRNPSLGVGSLPDGMAFAPNSRIGENGAIDASMSPTRGAAIDAANMRMHDREGQRDAAFGLTQAGLPGGLARALTYGQPDRGMYNRVLPGLVGHGGGAGPEVDPKAQMAASLAHGLIQGLAQGDKDGKVDWSKLPEMLGHIKDFSDQFDHNGTVAGQGQAPGWGGNKPLPDAGGDKSTPTAPSAPPPPVLTNPAMDAAREATNQAADRAMHQAKIDQDSIAYAQAYRQKFPKATDEQARHAFDNHSVPKSFKPDAEERREAPSPFIAPPPDVWGHPYGSPLYKESA